MLERVVARRQADLTKAALQKLVWNTIAILLTLKSCIEINWRTNDSNVDCELSLASHQYLKQRSDSADAAF
jgi:hypothetical protein